MQESANALYNKVNLSERQYKKTKEVQYVINKMEFQE